MTLAPQPHCEHECVCPSIFQVQRSRKEPCTVYECPYDTRPHTSTPIKEPWCYPGCKLVSDRAATIRNATLDLAMQAVDQIAIIYGIGNQLREHLTRSIESLRGKP